jgi:hypothetical protein
MIKSFIILNKILFLLLKNDYFSISFLKDGRIKKIKKF